MPSGLPLIWRTESMRPIVFRHDAGRRQHRTTLGNDSAVSLLHRAEMDDRIFSLDKGVLNRLVQIGLVAFNRQQIICHPGKDLLDNGALQPIASIPMRL